MGLFDNSALIGGLLNLVKSPRMQHLGNASKRAIPQVSGPFSGKYPEYSLPQSQSHGLAGASPIIGKAMNGILAQLSAGRQDPQGQQAQDPLMALYNQLVNQLQSPVNMPTGIDKEDLMRQVRGAIDPIYDQRIAGANSQYQKGSKDVQGMYGQLAKDFERLAPQQQAQADQAQNDISQLYGQLRSGITGDYSRVSKEQGELFKSLGIEDALPDVLAEQNPAVQDSLVAASENEAQQEQRYMDQGNIDETFYREGAPISKMAGNEVSKDLLFQLQQYVNQANSERTAGIQSAYVDQMGQANSQLMQQQQMAQQEGSRRQEMLWQMLQSQMQGGKQQEMTPDSFMASLDPNAQQSVAGAFTQLQRSPEMVYGKVEDPRNPVPGTFVDTTPQWEMAQVDAMLQRGEIDESTHQLLLMYIQLQGK